ncbi:MAG: hypothetical protein NTY02_13735, partial [Acidobacteria bacterium]|nr:hypothetical protein [Acidobacteriota bacterium]
MDIPDRAATSRFTPVIGLEVHVQLATASKMFCGCEAASTPAPNTRTCPVCLGLPGVLPVVNERAVDLAILVAIALDAAVAPQSVFARKNYFYPDLPKGYQITQHDRPLATGGRIGWSSGGRVQTDTRLWDPASGRTVS